ncbi:MAG TPA: 2-polyprenylphenol 6-hydroxylase [Alphaproteobacteria bacterium]|jgi:ubiquinone biosynthesis protein|nr:2-polyprenylphenol 6-hydroxylase [Alphaproteobacteria bacterium]
MLRAIENIVRLGAIATIFARHDALWPLESLGLPNVVMVPVRWLGGFVRKPGTPPPPGVRLAAALQECGPPFIKLGQALATRADLVGESVAEALTTLQDRLPPFPSEQAEAEIEADLGLPLDELFLTFDPKPVAAASIAQVHFATALDADGRERALAVKVLRPGIEAAFRRDLNLFYWLAEKADRFVPSLRRFRPLEVVRTFERVAEAEMDFRLEAAAASEFRENFIDDPTVKVPAVDWARTGQRVLTLERVGGIRIDDRSGLVAAGHDIDEILRHSSEHFFRQIFRDGYFHADLHPGNLFVGSSGEIIPVDFGIMGRIDVETRRFLGRMLLGLLTGDYQDVAEAHFDIGFIPRDQPRDDFVLAVRAIGEPIRGLPLAEISLARLLGQLFATAKRFNISIQPQLLLLQKTMMVAEGVGRTLNPNVNMWELARPLIEQWMRDNMGPQAELRAALTTALGRLRALPGTLARVESTLGDFTEGGLRLHPETLRLLAEDRRRASVAPALWVIAILLFLILLAL